MAATNFRDELASREYCISCRSNFFAILTLCQALFLVAGGVRVKKMFSVSSYPSSQLFSALFSKSTLVFLSAF